MFKIVETFLNLSKFENVALLGGVTMNGATIYSQAEDEIQRIEETIRQNEPPIMLGMG